MHSHRKLLSFLLCAVILLSLPAAAYADSSPAPFELTLLIDGGSDAVVRAYQESYEGNLYLSLMDLSLALNGTAAQFRLNYNYTNEDGESFTVLPGQAAAPVTGVTRLTVDSRHGVKHLGLARHRFFVGESERKYYSYRSTDRDLYMNLTVEVVSENAIRVYPDRPFAPDLEELTAQGYFDVFNGIVLADADTGRALYVNAPNRVLPIASLSKLLGYYLLADAMETFRVRCASGIVADRAKMAANLHNSLMLVTCLNPYIGYDNAARVAKKAYAEGTSLKDACVALGYMTEEQFDEVFHPEEMI